MRNKITILIMAAMLCLCTSCWFRYHTAIMAVDVKCGSQQQIEASEVIIKRAASIWTVYKNTGITNGVFTINYSGNDSLLNILVAQRGRISVAETFQAGELHNSLMAVYSEIEQYMETATCKNLPLYMPAGEFSPALIQVNESWFSFTDSVFKSKRHMFPANVSFVWHSKILKQPDGQEVCYELLALKTSQDEFLLNQDAVKNCEIKKLEKRNELVIELNEPYYKAFEHLTKKNIGKSLAIVTDDCVLTYPTVQYAITGGSIIVSGDFEYDDLLLIKAQIMGGELECFGFVYNPPAQ